MGVVPSLEGEISAAAADLREHDLMGQRVDELRRREAELVQHVDARRVEHVPRAGDDDRLEAVTLTRVVSALRGSKDDDLAREKAEADAARLRLAHTEAQLTAVQRELASAVTRVQTLSSAPTRFQQVLDDKEEALTQVDDPRAATLMELAEQRGRIEGEIRELAEAAEAAQTADVALREVAVKLDSASQWSTYDTFLGGGAVSSSIKHSRLDDAAAAATRADQSLAMLRTELADVDLAATSPRLDVDGGTRFFDIWLDNIFTDLNVRDRIRDGQRSVAHAANVVADITVRLAEQAAKAKTQLKKFETERHSLLTSQ